MQSLQGEEDMLHSDEFSFISNGGFIYLDANDVPVAACAIRIHSVASRFGTVNLSPDDNRITAPVASPELIDGEGIGLETDIYSFGCVMWEVFHRREAWRKFAHGRQCALPTLPHRCCAVVCGIHAFFLTGSDRWCRLDGRQRASHHVQGVSGQKTPEDDARSL